MIESIKKVTIETIQNRWLVAENNVIDIVQEASNLYTKITLACMFGADCQDLKLKQTYKGVDRWVGLGEVVIKLME